MTHTKTPHLNYYLAIEEDVLGIARYVELAQDNFPTYSLEIARLLMGATQELDVVLKQLCAESGDTSSSEQGYRTFLSTKYPAWLTLNVEMPTYDLSFQPFVQWTTAQTAPWWSANNRVKHHRHTHFASASVENMLNAVAALFIANVYLHVELSLLDDFTTGARLCYAADLAESISPTPFGMITNYKIII